MDPGSDTIRAYRAGLVARQLARRRPATTEFELDVDKNRP